MGGKKGYGGGAPSAAWGKGPKAYAPGGQQEQWQGLGEWEQWAPANPFGKSGQLADVPQSPTYDGRVAARWLVEQDWDAAGPAAQAGLLGWAPIHVALVMNRNFDVALGMSNTMWAELCQDAAVRVKELYASVVERREGYNLLQPPPGQPERMIQSVQTKPIVNTNAMSATLRARKLVEHFATINEEKGLETYFSFGARRPPGKQCRICFSNSDAELRLYSFAAAKGKKKGVGTTPTFLEDVMPVGKFTLVVDANGVTRFRSTDEVVFAPKGKADNFRGYGMQTQVEDQYAAHDSVEMYDDRSLVGDDAMDVGAFGSAMELDETASEYYAYPEFGGNSRSNALMRAGLNARPQSRPMVPDAWLDDRTPHSRLSKGSRREIPEEPQSNRKSSKGSLRDYQEEFRQRQGKSVPRSERRRTSRGEQMKGVRKPAPQSPRRGRSLGNDRDRRERSFDRREEVSSRAPRDRDQRSAQAGDDHQRLREVYGSARPQGSVVLQTRSERNARPGKRDASSSIERPFSPSKRTAANKGKGREAPPPPPRTQVPEYNYPRKQHRKGTGAVIRRNQRRAEAFRQQNERQARQNKQARATGSNNPPPDQSTDRDVDDQDEDDSSRRRTSGDDPSLDSSFEERAERNRPKNGRGQVVHVVDGNDFVPQTPEEMAQIRQLQNELAAKRKPSPDVGRKSVDRKRSPFSQQRSLSSSKEKSDEELKIVEKKKKKRRKKST